MKKTITTKLLFLLLICFGLTNCTDPYKIQTDTFEDILVVEATLTNILQKQTVKLTRTNRFEDMLSTVEKNAVVFVTDSDGTQYDFVEDNNVYTSVNEFEPVHGKQYRLTVLTSDGKKYISSSEVLPAVNNLQDVTASVQTVDGIRGVEIRAKSLDPSNSSQYYRYEYEETYKVISPKWIPFKAIITGPREIQVIQRTQEAKICYSTDKSTDIILLNTGETNENRVDFPVRFISNQNYIISYRYSILVHQYVHNQHAYNYYKTLQKVSGGSGNVLSPNQPGYFSGNLKCVTNPNEKVIGFFDVASVSSKRIFFDYADLFPGEPLPPFKVACNELVLDFCFTPPFCDGESILAYLSTNVMAVYEFIDAPIYTFIPTPCADCSSFSNNQIPPFWE